MGTAPVFPLILKMSTPAMFSMLIQALYNVVDSIYISRFDPEQNGLTAVSLAFPFQMIMVAVAVGTGVGLNSLISRRLGERDQKAADSAATHGIILALLSSLVFVVIGLTLSRPFISLFSDSATVVQMGTEYLAIVTALSFGAFIEVTLNRILQATGNMIIPMVTQIVGAVTNIILDPILIFGWFGLPAMGVSGAAIATVAGQILAMLVAATAFRMGKHRVRISLKGFRPEGKTIKDIYAVGLPAIVMQSIASVMNSGLNAILMDSEVAVKVLGVYFKLQSFVFMPVFGLNQGTMPIMGFNFGAGNKKRFMDTLKYGGLIALAVMILGTLLFQIFPEFLLGIFSDDPGMVDTGVRAFRAISLCFIPAALGITFSNVFQATGRGFMSLLISLLRQLVLILPIAWMISWFDLGMVWYAFPIAEAVSLVVSILLFVYLYKTSIANLIPIEMRQGGAEPEKEQDDE
ncbi:MAG: MATE family efflux transporter [Ruminococcaceae bacterium]|nr:MATE family efflux transporter [Oscillospiraceae bacterium]